MTAIKEYLMGLGLLTTLLCIRLLAHPTPVPLWLRLLCASCGGFTALLLYRHRTGRKLHTSQGSAAFANRAEWNALAFDSPEALPRGSVILGTRGGRLLALPRPYTTQHGLILGGSGTGKSFSFFLPNMALASGVSCIATDPKSELWNYTSGYHGKATRFAPTEPNASAGFNWIPLCADARMASLCARAIVEAGETTKQEAPWPDLETAFLAALFSHTSTLSVPTPLTAYRLLTRNDPDDLMGQFRRSSSGVAREQAVIFLQTHERMRGSITPVLAAKLQFMRDPRVARFTSSDFAAPDFGRLRITPEAVYWCVPEQDMTLLRALSALFFTVMLDQLAHESVSGREAIPVHLYLDEFANIGVLPQYDTTISLARGRGLSVWHGLQSLSQLESRYGRANAQTILTNCATKIALSGLDYETARYVSQSLGEATVTVRQPSSQRRRFALFAGSVGMSVGERARPLLTADEVRRIGEGEALVITGNRRPLRIDKYRYLAAPCTALAGALGAARALEMSAAPLIVHEVEEADEGSVTGLIEASPPPTFRMQSRGPRKGKRTGRRSTVIASRATDSAG